MTDPLRPLPAYADTACSPGQVGDPSSPVPRSNDEQRQQSPDCLIPVLC